MKKFLAKQILKQSTIIVNLFMLILLRMKKIIIYLMQTEMLN